MQRYCIRTCIGNTNLPVRFTLVCDSAGLCVGAVSASCKEGMSGIATRAHRPRHAHAEIFGVLVLAYTAVPRERAALLRVQAANTTG